jgi:two-component system, NarL family, nitrate/nitrite response regulator NarL
MRAGSHCRTDRLPHRRLRRLLLAGYDRMVRLSTTRSLASGSLRRTATQPTRNTCTATRIGGHRSLPAASQGLRTAVHVHRTDQLKTLDPAPRPSRLWCLIVDDSPIFVEAATRMLEGEGITVVGSASNSALALQRVGELRPDVLLVDVNLGQESGFDLAERLLRGGNSHPAVILTSSYSEDDLADLIVASPAAGFLPKAVLSTSAIRNILAARQ